MNPFARSDRVGGLIQQVLSEILNKDIGDPRLKMATITAVEVSRDLRLARIYFTTPGGKQKKDAAIEGFKSARGFIKKALAQEIDLKYMPDIKFFYDESLEYGAHIEALIKSTKN
ncbi:MAG: 30S ribosome-binding factor RbfA [Deltaproteobacteria bacterium]|jgi:ribosome-binding factor A|nr:30S ribosome-binding factor RbfA [Deltaproteobacteria bacterium]